MMRGMEIRIVGMDGNHLEAIDLLVSNGRFCGTASIYADYPTLDRFATAIEGFPRSANDRRSFRFGSRDPRYAGGFAELSFHCTDGAGRAVLTVVMEDEVRFRSMESATVSFAFEPAGLDRFLKDLRNLERTDLDHATLEAL